jgi:hypothetical protein
MGGARERGALEIEIEGKGERKREQRREEERYGRSKRE